MNYASFWKRTAAYLIDWFIFSVISFVVSFVLALLASVVRSTSTELLSTLVSLCLSVAIYVAYYVWPESSSWQATIGKKIFGLRVTDQDGQQISFLRSLGRNLSKFLSAAIFCVGYLMCFWTEKRQCLHDMCASCLVMDDTPEEKQGCAIGVIVAFVVATIALCGLAIFLAIGMQQQLHS